MRKLFLGLSLSLLFVFFLGNSVWAEGTLKVGYDFNGLTTRTGTTSNVNSGVTIGGEYLVSVDTGLKLGGGIAYQFDKEPTNDITQKFNFIPVYALLNYDISENEYLIARVGYNFFSGNVDYKAGNPLNGGFYYAAGAGVNFKDFQIEVLYSCNNGSETISNSLSNITYSQLSVNFGYRF